MTLLLFVLESLALGIFVHLCPPAVLVLAGAGIVRTLSQSLTLEYRIYDKNISCYDRWLQEPEWTIPFEQIQAISTTQGIIGRQLRFGTIEIETIDGERASIAHVRSHERVANALSART